MKKIMIVFISLVLMMSPITVTAADDITVILDGSRLQFDTKPIIVQGTTLVPLRAIFEAMDASVTWDQSTRTVTANRDNTTVELTIDNPTALKDGEEIHLTVPGRVVDGRTLVPLRFISESFGANVGWEQSTRTVTITTIDLNEIVLSDLKVHYIDVGQGDATLLQSEAFTILIDAGRHDRSDVLPYLKSAGVDAIDLFVLTHPHADHIGQAAQVLNEYPVTEVWSTANEHTSKTFERLLDAIIDSGASYVEPEAGEQYTVGDAEITILHPTDRLTGNLNDDSLSFRLDYGEVSFLFTGDAEADGEHQMMESGLPLEATILHVGHHGSRTSSTQSFLEHVKPEIAIYSAGSDNSYGHPHQEVIDRYDRMGVTLYGTDVYGTIIIATDGQMYDVYTSKDHSVEEIPSSVDGQGSCGPGQININTADVESLMEIQHIGEDRANQIIQLRDTRQFESVDDLTRIDGIATGRLNDIKTEGLACAA